LIVAGPATNAAAGPGTVCSTRWRRPLPIRTEAARPPGEPGTDPAAGSHPTLL